MSCIGIPSDTICKIRICDVVRVVSELDRNKEALEQVEKAIESEPVRGETLLRSRKLKRQLREAKKHLKSPIGKSR
jgi:hypothetical protein